MTQLPTAMLAEFHAKFDPTPDALGTFLPRRLGYLHEEVAEVAEASAAFQSAPTSAEAKGQLVKELVDVLYVVYGTLYHLGVDADAAFAEVHRSNMSKDANPHGKAIKGPNYVKADMRRVVG